MTADRFSRTLNTKLAKRKKKQKNKNKRKNKNKKTKQKKKRKRRHQPVKTAKLTDFVDILINI